MKYSSLEVLFIKLLCFHKAHHEPKGKVGTNKRKKKIEREEEDEGK